ncbi:MAG: hypothetical protein ACRECJ_11115, partial [Limisphaerales bacterium]
MKKGLWGFVLVLFYGGLGLAAEVAVLPAAGVVDRSESYRVLALGVPFPSEGKTVFRFPDEFSLKSLKAVKVFVQDGSPGDFKLVNFTIFGQSVEASFKNSSPAAARTLLFEFDKIQNPRRAGKFQGEVSVFKKSGEPISRFTVPFSLVADKPEKLSVAGPVAPDHQPHHQGGQHQVPRAVAELHLPG